MYRLNEEAPITYPKSTLNHHVSGLKPTWSQIVVNDSIIIFPSVQVLWLNSHRPTCIIVKSSCSHIDSFMVKSPFSHMFAA